jgi:hypothetical protein
MSKKTLAIIVLASLLVGLSMMVACLFVNRNERFPLLVAATILFSAVLIMIRVSRK